MAERIGAEAMHTLLNRFFDLALSEVHRYEGTINQFLGDGFMALFGAPIAHEDHARRAVLAALGLQERLQAQSAELGTPHGEALAMRIGLNTGPVVVGSIGDNLRMDYTAIGDTTNVAARLQQLAEPDAILISDSTWRLVHGIVRTEVLSPVVVKGKTETMIPYSVTGLRPRRSPLAQRGERALSPFVGRERELSVLIELFEIVEQGQGQVVGIAGEAGQGKSRFCYEFKHHLQSHRVTYLEGRCLSYDRVVPYHPLVDVLRSNCGIAESDRLETITEKVRQALQEVDLDVEVSLPYLLQLLEISEGTEALAALSPEAIKAQTFTILRDMSLSGSRQRPLVIEIEDLHWIDTTSEAFLASLVESLAGAPILLLTTYRPGYRPPWIDKSYATQIAVSRLASHDALRIVRSSRQHEVLSDHMIQMIIDKAEGNPFFLEEMTWAVTGAGVSQTDMVVPDTIQGVLMARIDQLPEASKRLLQTAAVLGREFSPHLLAAMWDCPETLASQLTELRQLEFLYERTGAEGQWYVFKHALTQDVAYDSLLTPRRQLLHAAAGQALETIFADRLEEVYDRLAYHYSKTDQAAKAVIYLSRFAEKAARSYAHVEAVTALQEAMTHVARLPLESQDRPRLELTLRHAHSLYYLGRFPESADLLVGELERLERFSEPSLSGPYYFWLAHMYSRLGDPERATRYAQQAVAQGEQCGDAATMGKAYTVLSLEGYWSGQSAQGIAYGKLAIEQLQGTSEPYWLGMAYCFLGYNYSQSGAFALALEAENQTKAIGEAISDPRIQTYAAFITGWIKAMIGDWDTAVAVCQRGLHISPDPTSAAYSSAFLGYAYLEKADAEQALPLLEEAAQRFQQFQFAPFEGLFTVFLAESHRCTEQLESAHQLAKRALDTTTQARYGYGVGWAQRTLGRIAQARGDMMAVSTSLQAALETFTSIQVPCLSVDVRISTWPRFSMPRDSRKR
jgi:class 3 adenylate cyclase/tetratricopeptide (TPR) repeat protein